MHSEKLRVNKKWIVAAAVIVATLLLVCAAITALAGGIGWLFGQGEESQLIRISSLAPLSTPASTTSLPDAEEATTPADSLQTQPSPPPLSLPENQPPPGTEIDTAPSPQPQPPPTIAPEYIAPVTRVVIPRLNLDSPVALSPLENQTWKVDHLHQTVGYLEGTALPGVDSNFVLAGHVTLASGVDGPFGNLGQLTPNDEIIVHSNGQEFVYVVNRLQTVDREAIEVTYPSDTAEITLITCSNWNDTENRYTDRLVVKGVLKE